MAAVAVAAAGLAAQPAAAAVKPITGSPLTLWVGDQGQLQGHRDGDTANMFFAPDDQSGDAGFFLAFPAVPAPWRPPPPSSCR